MEHAASYTPHSCNMVVQCSSASPCSAVQFLQKAENGKHIQQKRLHTHYCPGSLTLLILYSAFTCNVRNTTRCFFLDKTDDLGLTYGLWNNIQGVVFFDFLQGLLHDDSARLQQHNWYIILQAQFSSGIITVITNVQKLLQKLQSILLLS